MKVLVVLVLAVFTGCNARFFQADAPKPQLEMVKDAFWDYVRQATQYSDNTIQMIKKSEFGKKMSDQLAESTDLANVFATSLQGQLPPEAQQMIAKSLAELEPIKERVNQEMDSVGRRLMPQLEQMKTSATERAEQVMQGLLTFANERGLTETVMQRGNEVKTNMERIAADVQANTGAIMEEVQKQANQHMEGFKQAVAPVAQQVQAEVTQKFTELKEMALPYVEEVRDKIVPYMSNLQAQLQAQYDALTKTQ